MLPRARSLSTSRGRALTAPIGGCALGSMGRRRFRWCWDGTYPDRSPPWARASAIGVLEAGRDGDVAAALSQMTSRSDIVLLRLCNYDNLDASVTYKDARFTRH